MEEFLHSEDKALDLWWNWIRLTDYPCVKRIGNVELALVEEVEMKFGYKLRVYHISGNNKGNLKEECFFQTKEQMDKKYNELFRYDLYSLNPTAWEWKEQEWCRMAGY